MFAVSRFVSAVVQDRIVYAVLASTLHDKCYIGISRCNVHFVQVYPSPRNVSFSLRKLRAVTIDLNDESAMKLEFSSGQPFVVFTQEREEFIRELAVRYSTIQRYDTMMGIDFPLRSSPSIVEGKRASIPVLMPRAPRACHRLTFAGHVFYVPQYFVPQFHLRQKYPFSGSPFFGASLRCDKPEPWVKSTVTPFQSIPPFLSQSEQNLLGNSQSCNSSAYESDFHVAECTSFLAEEGECLEIWVLPPTASHYINGSLQLRHYTELKIAEIGEGLFSRDEQPSLKEIETSLRDRVKREKKQPLPLSAVGCQQSAPAAIIYTHDFKRKQNPINDPSSCLLWECQLRAYVPGRDIRVVLMRRSFIPPFALATQDIVFISFGALGAKYPTPATISGGIVKDGKEQGSNETKSQTPLSATARSIERMRKAQLEAEAKRGMLSVEEDSDSDFEAQLVEYEDITTTTVEKVKEEIEKKNEDGEGGKEEEERDGEKEKKESETENESTSSSAASSEQQQPEPSAPTPLQAHSPEPDESTDSSSVIPNEAEHDIASGTEQQSGESQGRNEDISEREQKAKESTAIPQSDASDASSSSSALNMQSFAFNYSSTPSVLSQQLFLSAETVASSCHPLYSSTAIDPHFTKALIDWLYIPPTHTLWHKTTLGLTPSFAWKMEHFMKTVRTSLKKALPYSRKVIGSSQIFSLNNAIPIPLARNFGNETEKKESLEKKPAGMASKIFSLFGLVNSSTSGDSQGFEMPPDDAFEDFSMKSLASGLMSGVGSVFSSASSAVKSVASAVTETRSKEDISLSKATDPFVVISNLEETPGGVDGSAYEASAWVEEMKPWKRKSRRSKLMAKHVLKYTTRNDGSDCGIRRVFCVDVSEAEKREIWGERLARYLVNVIEKENNTVTLFDMICIAVTEELALTDPEDLQLRLARQSRRNKNNPYLSAQMKQSSADEAQDAASLIPGAMFLSQTSMQESADKANALGMGGGGPSKKVSGKVSAAIILPPDVSAPKLRRPPKSNEEMVKEAERKEKEKEKREREKKLRAELKAKEAAERKSKAGGGEAEKAKRMLFTPVDLPFKLLDGFEKDDQLQAADVASRLLGYFLHLRIPGTAYRSKRGLRDVVKMLMSGKHSDSEVNEFRCNEDVFIALLKSGCFQQYTSPMVAETCVRTLSQIQKEKEKKKAQFEKATKIYPAHTPKGAAAQKALAEATKAVNDNISPVQPEVPSDISPAFVQFLCIVLRRALFQVNFVEDDISVMEESENVDALEEMADIEDIPKADPEGSPQTPSSDPNALAKSSSSIASTLTPAPSPLSSPPLSSPSMMSTSSTYSAANTPFSTLSSSLPSSGSSTSSQNSQSARSLHKPSFIRAVLASPREYNRRLVATIADIIARLALNISNRFVLGEGGVLNLLRLFLSGEGIFCRIPEEFEDENAVNPDERERDNMKSGESASSSSSFSSDSASYEKLLPYPSFTPITPLEDIDDPTLLSLLRCLLNISSSNIDAKASLCTAPFVSAIVALCHGHNELVTSCALQILRLVADASPEGRFLVLVAGGVSVAVSSLRMFVVPGLPQSDKVITSAAQLLWTVSSLKEAKREAKELGALRRLSVLLQSEETTAEETEKMLGAINKLLGPDDLGGSSSVSASSASAAAGEGGEGGESEVKEETPLQKEKRKRMEISAEMALCERREILRREETFCSFGDASVNDVDYLVDSLITRMMLIVKSYAPPSTAAAKEKASSALPAQSNSTDTTTPSINLDTITPISIKCALGDPSSTHQLTIAVACLLKLMQMSEMPTADDPSPPLFRMQVLNRIASSAMKEKFSELLEAMHELKADRTPKIAAQMLDAMDSIEM
ncbi:uncharacterized protein MONOS_12859 [Monocercomonoides exilis]|uniref:uncharacterized protein n=1 Tax=Monocercomonoides exilis TaxID=2049356 RepID=UPI00355AC914|nr:hypothetical protein MONOS_12859 [Monocercomonoides exilis]|eukprot:MONOS_12859.1-p1 / transcript=MONOS_12859.1 / gene=MONOS_12859 / organism=Monocercomonoides_exilis_PA203 / gene_product=unspecified product / transcript_product=unspecified product / location=Mono_scaffold00743:20043-26091(-) / protein_length=1853 / sequence_SO=supercontig / SO=protein_coding / is_pseudo=false